MNGGMDAYNMAMMGGMGPMNGGRRPQPYQPPDQKRGICRDYHSEFPRITMDCEKNKSLTPLQIMDTVLVGRCANIVMVTTP